MTNQQLKQQVEHTGIPLPDLLRALNRMGYTRLARHLSKQLYTPIPTKDK